MEAWVFSCRFSPIPNDKGDAMKRSRKGVGILFLGIACVLFSGCNFIRNRLAERMGTKPAKQEEAKPVTPPPPFEGRAPAPSPTPPMEAEKPVVPPPAKTQNSDQALIEELNGYVGCLNRTSSRANQSRERYLS